MPIGNDYGNNLIEIEEIIMIDSLPFIRLFFRYCERKNMFYINELQLSRSTKRNNRLKTSYVNLVKQSPVNEFLGSSYNAKIILKVVRKEIKIMKSNDHNIIAKQ
jgi:hypothetical protein